MKSRPRRLPLAAVLAAALTAFTPLSFSSDQGLARSTAECVTCCKQLGATCIKCAEDCVKVDNAYDRGIGACSPLQPVG